jgi:LuxR family maltose regulon positive regulatory protein
MNAAIRGTLTLVIAPAGWGKTTLLHAWHAETSCEHWPLAWVSLDTGDNDPIRFWAYVISALNTLHPGVGETPLALLYAASPPPIEDVLAPLLNALIELSTETVLVLDDFHHIEAPSIHDALTFLVERLPPKLHLVLASRGDPLLPLARLRVQGTLTELRAPDLRFTVEETAEFLLDVMGLPLSREQVAALQARTEGWITGLQLASLSLQGREQVAGFIDAFTGSHRYIVDYLVDEVLVRQPVEVQDFLVQTSILDRLCGPLCDAVRWRADSQALLAHVERSNLFLVALDDERHWYRYHHLFAEVLRNRLQQTHSVLVPELHRRASSWYEHQELVDEAITQALAIPELERAARLMQRHSWSSNFPSQFQLFRGWLNHLPETFVRTQPLLCIMHAITLLLTHQLDQAETRIKDTERFLDQEMPTEQRRTILGGIAASRGSMARLLGDYERAIPLAQHALDLVPEMEETLLRRMIYPTALLTVASSYLMNGDLTATAERQVEDTVSIMGRQGTQPTNLPTTLRSISNLARFKLLQGRLRQAASTIEQLLHMASGHDGLQALLNGADYYFIQGELLREWNQLEQAKQHLEQGMDLDRGAMMAEAEMITRGFLALARLQQACGQHTHALQTLNSFAQMAQQRGFASTLVAQGAAVRAHLVLVQGDLAAALHWTQTSGVSATEALSYPHEREYLTLVRVRIAQGRQQPGGSFLPEALALLERLLADAEPRARLGSVIEILLLRALALQAQSKQEEALRTLGRALTLAEPEGYLHLFLDEGPPLLSLLRQAYARQITPGYVRTLLEAAGQHMRPTPHRSSVLGELLTEREREVLRLLVEGASNREIAEHLVLSVNTVKKHVFNICSKLSVQSRAQAIARVRTLNILIY